MFLDSKQNLNFYWCIWHLENYQKQNKIKKVMALQSRDRQELNHQMLQKLIPKHRKKNLVCCSAVIRVQRQFIEFQCSHNILYHLKWIRKIWGLKVGGIKMKKNEKNMFCNSKQRIFFTALFGLVLWLCSLKMMCRMMCRACQGSPISFYITQNGEESVKVFSHR